MLFLLRMPAPLFLLGWRSARCWVEHWPWVWAGGCRRHRALSFRAHLFEECLCTVVLRGKWCKTVALLKGSVRSKPWLKIKSIWKLPTCAKCIFSSLCAGLAGPRQTRSSVWDPELFALHSPFPCPPLQTGEHPRTPRCLCRSCVPQS